MLTPLPLIAFMGLGVPEMMICGVVAVLLFGSRLPSVARSAGKSLTEFKKGMQDLQDDVRDSIEIKEPTGTASQTPASQTSTTQAATTEASTERSPTEGDGDTYDSYPKPESPHFESSPVESSPVEVPAADKSST